ncbi:MAG TPA: MauE/DoxX family redox-associated membrane protein [Ktedonobacterales bacterium]|nr:MauE/DoxX family redox-associated membrane protein [Ktedonobacterales bacterium]
MSELPMSLMVMAYVLTFCRVVTGLVFLISGVSKAGHLPQFKQTIITFRLLPNHLSGITALLFLAGEFGVVLLMIAGGHFLLPGFILAITLLAVFCGALASVLARSLHTSCNCFGPSEKPVTVSDLWRNLGFIVCALGGCVTQTWLRETDTTVGWLAWIPISLGALVFVVIWVQLGEIAQLLRSN